MGWYVEALLLNKDLIRAKNDIDSDEFNDLLLVEKELSCLTASNLLTTEELNVLDAMMSSANFFIANEKLGLTRKTIAKIFKRVCGRISYKLGSYFTDEGYLAYLGGKHGLNAEQLETIRSYMNSKLRYRLVRQIYEQRDNSYLPLD